ncbi:MAG: hypothetical protein ACTSR3_17680 [Candidatus Helarchaeota archaeon]
MAYNHQLDPEISYIGSGGTIIIWQDNRNGNYDILCSKNWNDR